MSFVSSNVTHQQQPQHQPPQLQLLSNVLFRSLTLSYGLYWHPATGVGTGTGGGVNIILHQYASETNTKTGSWIYLVHSSLYVS